MNSKRSIRNPEKWIGKYVRHMANWRNFEYTSTYFVCEWTGKLYRLEDEGILYYAEEIEAYSEFGWDACYTYSWEAIREFEKLAKAS